MSTLCYGASPWFWRCARHGPVAAAGSALLSRGLPAPGRLSVSRKWGTPVYGASSISAKGRMHFMVFTETFDAKVMCRFLDRLIGHFDRKIHLVVDGHSAHRSRAVRTWLADHADRIELHFLPSYSPELNPDELVNADLKRSLPMSSRARNQAQLAAETRRFYQRRSVRACRQLTRSFAFCGSLVCYGCPGRTTGRAGSQVRGGPATSG